MTSYIVLCIPLLELLLILILIIAKIVNTYMVFDFTGISWLRPFSICLCSSAHFATRAKYNFGDDERKPFTDHICGYRQLVGVICICSMDVNWLITDNISLSSWLTFFSINSYSHSDDMFIIIKSNINTDASIGFDICINYHPVKFPTTRY